MSNNKIRTTIYLPLDLLIEAKRKALDKNTSVSELIRQLLEKLLKK